MITKRTHWINSENIKKIHTIIMYFNKQIHFNVFLLEHNINKKYKLIFLIHLLSDL